MKKNKKNDLAPVIPYGAILAVIKGLVEHNQPDYHFGSTMALDTWINSAQLDGYVKREETGIVVTEKGMKLYNEKLKSIPAEPRRWNMWNPIT